MKLAVPSFASLRKVMTELEAVQTLHDAGLPQPESAVVLGSAAVKSCAHLLPGYSKTRIGSASAGVRRVDSLQELEEAISALACAGKVEFPWEKLLLQKELQGSGSMISGGFPRRGLRAWHTCVSIYEGLGRGVSEKASLPLLVVREHLVVLGRCLD